MLEEDIKKHIGHCLGCRELEGKAVIVCESCGNMILVIGENKSISEDSKIVIPAGKKKMVYFYYTGEGCNKEYHGAFEEKIEMAGPVTAEELYEQAQDIAYERSQLEAWWEMDED